MQIETIPTNEFNEFYDILMKILAELIPKLTENTTEEIPTTFGALIKPFGLGKLKILELIHVSLKIPPTYNLSKLLSSQKIFNILLVKTQKKSINLQKIEEFDENLRMEFFSSFDNREDNLHFFRDRGSGLF